jgi:molecular chaperone GrpE
MTDDIKIEEEGKEPKGKLKKLKEQLKKCQKEKEEYLAGWQRSKADFINARKEEEKRHKKFMQYANQMFIYELLTILDSFDLALSDYESRYKNKKSSNSDEVDQITKGYLLIKSQFEEVLKKHGLKPIKAVGEKFNPEFHESVAEIKSKKEKGTIVEETQKGYMLHDIVLRPSKVKIAT